MKKYRILSFLLATVLAASLTMPLSALAAPAAEPTVAEQKVAATTAILVDADTDEVLFAQNAHERRFPASVTKVMTALMVFEAIERGELTMDQPVTASSTYGHDLSPDGSTQNIKTGETLTVEQLLNCLLVVSANESANILAETVAGDTATFLTQMNARAKELGCNDTHFVNCHGLHNDEHYTSAYDISLYVRAAMKFEGFLEIVKRIDYTVPATDLHAERHFYNTNALVTSWNYIGYTYEYAIGVKTGNTPEAGRCLASAAKKNGRTLVSVVMDAPDTKDASGTTTRQDFFESRRMLQWGFSHFSLQTVLDSKSMLKEVAVTLSKDANYVGVQPLGTIEVTLPTELSPADFEQKITLTAETLEAPVTKGQVLGSVTVSYDGKDYGTLPLVAVADISRSEMLYRLDQIKVFFSQLWVKVTVIALALLIAFFLLRWLIFGKKYKYGHGGYGKKRPRYGGRGRRSK